MFRITYSIILCILSLYTLQSSAFVSWYKVKNLDFPTKCTVGYNVFKGDTCESIAEKFEINLDHFKHMNSFPCEELAPSDKVCIGGSYVKCKDWRLIQEGTTCDDFMREYQLSEQKFRRLNPTVVCEQLIIEPYLFLCAEGEIIKVSYKKDSVNY